MRDYWHWLAMGFQGLVGMMKQAKADGLLPGREAKELLRKFLEELKQLIEE